MKSKILKMAINTSIEIFDSEQTSHGTQRKLNYSKRIGIRDDAAMSQAFKDITKSESLILQYTVEYKYVVSKVHSNRSRRVPIIGTGIMDRYSIGKKELRQNPKTFSQIYNQIAVINVKEW